MNLSLPDSNQGESRKIFENFLIAKALQDVSFKDKLIKNPKAIIAKEFGTQLPADINVIVLEETDKILYIVLPYRADKMPYKNGD